jgi:pantoate--beta-alanine ligase
VARTLPFEVQPIEIISETKRMQERSEMLRRQGKTIVFVPTMGFLHDGHLSLMRKGKSLGDDLVASIFINPTQFAPGEDLASYPKNLERDLELTQNTGVDAVFLPEEKSMYTKEFQTHIDLDKLPNHLCGISRPIFFRGVATVVAKLFNIVKPHVAVFGHKDYQQLMVIRQMVKDLDFGIEIVGAPTIREPDGLAMSSRNTYLTSEQRASALSLHQSMKKAQKAIEKGERNATRLIDMARAFIQSHAHTEIDYINICDPDTLVDIKLIDKPVVMALAVKVGKARLIDNMILNP